MITYKDIKLSVNNSLINKFNLPINSNDVKEGFSRPSFFVELDNFNPSSTLVQVEKNLTIRIYYFPSDRYDYSLELLDIQEGLESLFDLKLSVLDRQFTINDKTADVVDGVLNFYFDLHFFDGKDNDPSDEGELMDTLVFRKG
ncbi:phage tail terminator family protein [Metabacillus litoralis]|uniref:phage tail terminator family protein n=1 Tax=Metabacillus litoralis TaxID=152268 RepID=UPI00203CD4CC|nr:hypothetical protein [Metabacillus litoralis]MCM3411464.1 hypothetical protein [Metabacillus litoralis]